MCSSLYAHCSWVLCTEWTGKLVGLSYLAAVYVHHELQQQGAAGTSQVGSHWCNSESILLSHNRNKQSEVKLVTHSQESKAQPSRTWVQIPSAPNHTAWPWEVPSPSWASLPHLRGAWGKVGSGCIRRMHNMIPGLIFTVLHWQIPLATTVKDILKTADTVSWILELRGCFGE